MRVERITHMAIRPDHEAMRLAAELPTSGPIPGEHDHTSEPATQPGIVGTTGYGVDLPEASVDPTLDEETRKQSRWEGGGFCPD